jgi:type II secretory pathway pseudopilin PulG
MVSVAIVAMLVGITIPAYSQFREKGKVAQAQSDLKGLQTAIQVLVTDTEQWPGPNPIGIVSHGKVWDLNSSNAGIIPTSSFPNCRGPCLPLIKKKPWGSDYFFNPDYNIAGVDYSVVGSFGPNKLGPNAYDSDDAYIILPAM